MTEETFKYRGYDIIYTFSEKAFSKKLIVVFSGYVKNNAEDKHPYNFQNVLSTFPANVLYIRDNLGNRGVYYLCYQGDFSVSDAICALIRDICEKHNISMQDVITLGSSKGASSALHIGLSLNCGNIIASVPQTKIATYIDAVAEDTYQDMIPMDDDGAIFKKIDNYIFDQINAEYSSRIHVLTSENDSQYETHIAPILPILRSKETNIITINNSIVDHGDVVNFNPNYAILTLFSIVFGCTIKKTENKIKIIINNSDYIFSAKVTTSDESNETHVIDKCFTLDTDKVLQIELSVEKNDVFRFSWNIYNWLKNLMNAKIELTKGRPIISIQNNMDLLVPIDYALYQSSNSIVQFKYPYQKSNSFVLSLTGETIPTDFQLFCKDKFQRASQKIGISAIQFGNNLQKDLFTTKYTLSLDGNELHFRLFTDCYDDSYAYCFYILKGDEIVFKGNYTSQSELNYKLNSYGSYCVLYFIMHNGQREYLYSKSIEYKKPVTISIFGSCVSRDLFEYDQGKEFLLEQYVARQSIISAVSLPLKQPNFVVSLDSNFQKRMVEMDLMKTTFDYFKSNLSDYLLIDLIDERFPLVLVNNSYFTASNEAIKGCGLFSTMNKLYKKITNEKLYIDSTNVDQCIKEFCQKVNALYPNDRIIIHRALLVDYYTDKNGKIVEFPKHHKKNNKKVNSILNYMYDALIARLPGVSVIDEMNEATADESHKWGLAPMHYKDDYYRKVLKDLSNVIKK